MEAHAENNKGNEINKIKYDEYVFWVSENAEKQVKVECENRQTYEKFSSGFVSLKRVNPEIFTVALERTVKTIQCDLMAADAKIVLTVKVSHEYLPVISETLELQQICGAEQDPDMLVLKKLNSQLDEVRLEMNNLRANNQNSQQYNLSSSLQPASKQKISDLVLPQPGTYLLQVSFVAKCTTAEPTYTISAYSNELINGLNQVPVIEETVPSQFTFTSYSTFQTFQVILNDIEASQKALSVYLTATAQANLTNLSVRAIKV